MSETKLTNIIDLEKFYKFFFRGEKSKYINLFVNLTKKSIRHEFSGDLSRVKEYKNELMVGYSVCEEQIKELSDTDLFLLCYILNNSHILGTGKYRLYKNFIKLNERGLIPNNDVTTYDSFEKIQNTVSVAELKLIEKEMEKEVIKLYSDDEWLVLRPLTHLSSEKYGYGTKWCTTMNIEYFLRYSRHSTLIYIINKISGLKVALHSSLKDGLISFWNAEDDRIDSMQAKLPNFIIDILQSEIKISKDNFGYLCKEKQELEIKKLVKFKNENYGPQEANGPQEAIGNTEEAIEIPLYQRTQLVNPNQEDI